MALANVENKPQIIHERSSRKRGKITKIRCHNCFDLPASIIVDDCGREINSLLSDSSTTSMSVK